MLMLLGKAIENLRIQELLISLLLKILSRQPILVLIKFNQMTIINNRMLTCQIIIKMFNKNLFVTSYHCLILLLQNYL